MADGKRAARRRVHCVAFRAGGRAKLTPDPESSPPRPPLSRRKKPVDCLDKLPLPTPPAEQQKQKLSIYVLHKPVKFTGSLQVLDWVLHSWLPCSIYDLVYASRDGCSIEAIAREWAPAGTRSFLLHVARRHGRATPRIIHGVSYLRRIGRIRIA
jgi:hypothetical protein